ncbi:MAG: hypothetical protein IKP95_04745 [Ruminococcus sp.]|nr:hypothetical protein [Ruminococcus sp.]
MANTKRNSAKRKLVPAIAMLTTSAIMLSTATYAWFTMNKEVTVQNMQVQAKADQGLLINEVATAGDQNWDELATTSQSTGIQLHATSTANTDTWYVAYSTKSNTAAAASAGQASTDLTTDGYRTLGTAPFATTTETVDAAAGTNAKHEIIYVDKDADSEYDLGEGYYVKYTYYLKSSGDALSLTTAQGNLNQSLWIKDMTITNNNNTGMAQNQQDLDAALRVAVVVNKKVYFFAPVSGATTSYYVNAASAATTAYTTDQQTCMDSIPAVTADGTPVYVYLYFEGEDAKLKTDNVISTLDNVTVSFKFALEYNTAAPADNGVAVPSLNTQQGG